MFFRYPRLAAVLIASGLLSLPLTVGAAESPAETPAAGFCQQNPAKCQELNARRDVFCAENPQACAARNEGPEARKAYCAENPEKCEAAKEKRKELKERVETLKARCEQDPESCDPAKRRTN